MRRARSVAYRTQAGPAKAKASGEIILAAGAFGSPQLLQLSGVGPGALLQEHGIDVVHDSPGVGENLHDHWMLRVLHRVKNASTLNNWLRTPLHKAVLGARYVLGLGGPMGAPVSLLTGFAKSDPSVMAPDIQFQIVRDKSRFIRLALEEVELHLWIGALLVAVTVLLFMHDWRSTIIASLAIPASVIATFAALHWFGFTLNNITMLGLVLAVALGHRVDIEGVGIGRQRAGARAEDRPAAGHPVELHHALRHVERIVVGQRDHARGELDALGMLAGRRQEHLRRCDHLPARRMMLAAPELVVAQLVEPLDQLHVAPDRERRVLAHPMERREEDAEFQTPVCHCPERPLINRSASMT